MKTTRPSRHGFGAALAALLGLGFGLQVSAETVTTVPVGALSVTIAAGTGSSRALTILSFPLIDQPLATGQVTGKITGLTANTITNSGAGWTAGGLSNAASPYLIQITSGLAKGHTFLVSSVALNTADTITIDGEEAGLVNLTSLGIATGQNGDTYRIIPCDTLSSLLGNPETMGVLGSTASASADVVQVLVQGAYRQYYYNTNSMAWLRVGPNTPSNNLPIRPDTVVIYSRLANTPISLLLTGAVPSIDRRAIIRSTGVTTLSTGWPKDATLSSLGLHHMPGWVSSANQSIADVVSVQVQGAYRQYYHNGANWVRVGPGTLSDGVIVPAGSGILVGRKSLAAGSQSLVQEIPYSL